MTADPRNEKETDDVSGAARAAEDPTYEEAPDGQDGATSDEPVPVHDPDRTGVEWVRAPAHVEDLAQACVRFVKTRYGATLDFQPDTLSFVDQWIRDARPELSRRPEAIDVVQSAAGAYFGEVVRRTFGGSWIADGEMSDWRVCLSQVYCAFNPIGIAREALLLRAADGWKAHLELDPGERDGIEQRLSALPAVDDDEYYAPSTRFDVMDIVVAALRMDMQSRGLADVAFGPEDYAE